MLDFIHGYSRPQEVFWCLQKNSGILSLMAAHDCSVSIFHHFSVTCSKDLHSERQFLMVKSNGLIHRTLFSGVAALC